jgi:hypothetical protein
MGILNKNIKKVKADIVKKQAPGSVSDVAFVQTGLDLVDYYTGTISTNRESNEEYYNLGLPMGKILMYVGHSQSGKTTKAIQDAWGIVGPMNGDIILADFERSSNDARSRFKAITGMSDDEFENSVTIFNHETMTAEFLKQQIFDIAEAKRGLEKSDLLDWYTIEGKECKIFPPTVIIIDSVAAMRSKELLENKDMDGNMVAAAIAKSNGAFLTSVEHLLEAYNITLMPIGHITKKITINPYAPKSIQLPGLQDDETISGGNKFVFLASYVFRLKAGKEYKDDKDLGVQGRLVYCEFLKTRSGYNKMSCPLFYHGTRGFVNELTTYYQFKEELGILKKDGTKFKLPNYDLSFAQKDFVKLYASNDEFREAYNELAGEKFARIMENKRGNAEAASVDRNDLEEEFAE